MQIKFLHLNIYKGLRLADIIEFIKKERFDIVNLQEVSGGSLSYVQEDIFDVLLKETGYSGQKSPRVTMENDPSSYDGPATLFTSDFKLINKNVIWLKDYFEIEKFDSNIWPDLPHNVLHLLLEKNGKKINTLNTHLAWGKNPNDEDYKVEQGEKLFNYVKTVTAPFILFGDFNVIPSSQIVKNLDTVARNLTVEHQITNTLNPRLHRVKELFPKGIAVDYIYTDFTTKIDSFEVLENNDLSDHFGIIATFEI